ncbi:MAG TPA: hypothetical protein PK299_09565 [Anaerolineales bacterium]|nr:hypothetical protein [Anaerolineales bacterium]
MKSFKFPLLVLFFLCSALLACSWLDEEVSSNGQETCAPNEVYDETDGLCYPAEDSAPAGDEEVWWEDESDCLPGEVYDPQEGVCYEEIDCDLEDDVCWENAVFTELDPILDDYLSGKEDFKESDLEEGGDQILTTYEIDGTRLKAPADVADPNSLDETLANLQADHAYHREVWAYFAKLIPAEQRRDLIRFQAVSDGEGEVLASVEPDTDDPKKWIINVDILDAQADMKELTYTLVHEFAHVLTLNNRQVPMDTDIFFNPTDEDLYNQRVSACPRYFTGEGCAKKDSYINLFFTAFWSDKYDEWVELDYLEDEDEYYAQLDELYQKYADEFVTDYAATNPAEDIAESFTQFVFSPKPRGNGKTIADQKVLFFYDFPELVTLREEIVSRAAARNKR